MQKLHLWVLPEMLSLLGVRVQDASDRTRPLPVAKSIMPFLTCQGVCQAVRSQDDDPSSRVLGVQLILQCCTQAVFQP